MAAYHIQKEDGSWIEASSGEDAVASLVFSEDENHRRYGRLLATGALEKLMDWMEGELNVISDDDFAPTVYAVVRCYLEANVAVLASFLARMAKKGREETLETAVSAWVGSFMQEHLSRCMKGSRERSERDAPPDQS